MAHGLIRGSFVPDSPATLADRRIHASGAELEAALHGRVTTHHRFLLRLHLDHLEALETAIARIDEQVDANLQPFRSAIELLVAIPGVSRLSAEIIVSEMGLDMNRFATDGQLVSWAGLCPRNDENAGKRRSNQMKKGSTMAEDNFDPMRLVRHSRQKRLPLSPISSTALT